MHGRKNSVLLFREREAPPAKGDHPPGPDLGQRPAAAAPLQRHAAVPGVGPAGLPGIAVAKRFFSFATDVTSTSREYYLGPMLSNFLRP
jgi:hypothetical protein